MKEIHILCVPLYHFATLHVTSPFLCDSLAAHLSKQRPPGRFANDGRGVSTAMIDRCGYIPLSRLTHGLHAEIVLGLGVPSSHQFPCHLISYA